MDLPDIHTLNLFNKVLISLWDLTPDGLGCSKESLIRQCEAIAFGGYIGNYDTIIDLCKQSGLIRAKNGTYVLSSIGDLLIRANKERYFELNEAQKNIIAEKVVFNGPWNSHARELFEFFNPNFGSECYELSTVDNLLPIKHNLTIQIFKQLGIIKTDYSILRVDNRYTELVYKLTSDIKGISEQELEKILMENRKLGAKAENAAVEFEKRRLRKLGRFVQADLVRRISTVNTGAGYDIESFDGNSDELNHNRFIEVKATTRDELRFFWTHNEIKVAKRKKDTYWIYVYKHFQEKRPNENVPIIIQNPERNIPEKSCLTMEAHTFLIKEIEEIRLEAQRLEDISWYNLV